MEKKNISYEEMSKGSQVFEESEVPYYDEPKENEFESRIPGSNGLDKSGMK